MPTVFELIKEDFMSELDAIRLLVTTFDAAGKPPKARVAAANSATLLVAATFEEYIRQSAREYARVVVTNTSNAADLPKNLAATAWKRSMERLAKVRFDVKDQPTRDSLFLTTGTRFSVVHEFVRGDLSQDIYEDLIHNENNMRPTELNSMFKVAGLSDVCSKLCEQQTMKDHFEETEQGKAHGKLLTALEEFMDRRNNIAHALNPGSSTGADQIIKDLDMLEALANSLCQTLEALIPAAPAAEAVAVAIAPGQADPAPAEAQQAPADEAAPAAGAAGNNEPV
jgi:hypothetical protein